MKLLEELIRSADSRESRSRLNYAGYLYRDLVTEDNRALLDEYTATLIDALQERHTNNVPRRRFKSEISQAFYEYLLRTGKKPNTAYDYVKRVERICKENGISIEDLFYRRTGCSIEDLIGMYSSGNKVEENKKLHNAPLSALRQFKDFMNEHREAVPGDNGSPSILEDGIYLCDDEGFQSFARVDRHVSRIEIHDRSCRLTYTANRLDSGVVDKTINEANYRELILVFSRYKSILSTDVRPAFEVFPHGGVRVYKYRFEEKSNCIGGASLFQSANQAEELRAYKEYHAVIDKIIAQP